MTDLVERLRQTAEAYPADVFGDVTDADRQEHGAVVQRAAAHMGRHMAPLLREAADALEAAREDAERYRWLAKHFRCDPDMGGNHRWWSCVPRPIPRGPTIDAAIDAARKESGHE